MFNERLEKYRKEYYFNKTEMADKLDVSNSYYSLIESGKRNPSKNFIEKLASLSEKPKEYWLYGITLECYSNAEDNFKSLREALDIILGIQILHPHLILSKKTSFKF